MREHEHWPTKNWTKPRVEIHRTWQHTKTPVGGEQQDNTNKTQVGGEQQDNTKKTQVGGEQQDNTNKRGVNKGTRDNESTRLNKGAIGRQEVNTHDHYKIKDQHR